MERVPDRLTQDSIVTAVATVVGYGVILLAMFLLLFALPYVVFRAV